MPIKNKHRKHPKLNKPFEGIYHHNEWQIIGDNCDNIFIFTQQITETLPDLKIGYLDNDHNPEQYQNTFYTHIEKKDKLSEFKTKSIDNPYQTRKFVSNLDLLFVNGNHYQASKQIILLNEQRLDKLEKKISTLNNIQLVVTENQNQEIPGFLLNQIGKTEPIIIPKTNISELVSFFMKDYHDNKVLLNGLVLAGGNSQRMGLDKGQIVYHQKEQREHEADLLNGFCAKTFISCKKEHQDSIQSQYDLICDTYIGLGPYGGILSALREHPDRAWLVVACDLPFLTQSSVEQLISERDTSKLATCFYNKETQFPEPLITIWEPRAYPILLDYLSQGFSCPRKVLINEDIKMIEPVDNSTLININSKEDWNTYEDRFTPE